MGPGHFFVARDGSATSGFGKFSLQTFLFGSKRISLVWVKKYRGQRRVGLLFAVGQKYALVRLGQGPPLVRTSLSAFFTNAGNGTDCQFVQCTS